MIIFVCRIQLVIVIWQVSLKLANLNETKSVIITFNEKFVFTGRNFSIFFSGIYRDVYITPTRGSIGQSISAWPCNVSSPGERYPLRALSSERWWNLQNLPSRRIINLSDAFLSKMSFFLLSSTFLINFTNTTMHRL